MRNAIIKEFLAHQETIATVIETMQEPLLEASKLAVETLRAGNKILLCGNGGSAADAQHIAAELTGRYKSIFIPYLKESSTCSPISNTINNTTNKHRG